jgi:hypothetical protein
VVYEERVLLVLMSTSDSRSVSTTPCRVTPPPGTRGPISAESTILYAEGGGIRFVSGVCVCVRARVREREREREREYASTLRVALAYVLRPARGRADDPTNKRPSTYNVS